MASTKEDYRRRRRLIVELLGSKCVRCGASDESVLQFDHKEPSEKSFCISSNWGISMARLISEIAKCQLLCYDCHLGKSKSEGSLATAPPATHGTAHMYGKYGCRCGPCKDAKRESRTPKYLSLVV